MDKKVFDKIGWTKNMKVKYNGATCRVIGVYFDEGKVLLERKDEQTVMWRYVGSVLYSEIEL